MNSHKAMQRVVQYVYVVNCAFDIKTEVTRDAVGNELLLLVCV
jgi:hypothetical protein